MRYLFEKSLEYIFYVFIILLPWQTRWIWHEELLNGQYWEYGSFSLYAVDIILIIIVILALLISRQKVFVTIKKYWVIILSFLLLIFASSLIAQNKEISWFWFGKVLEGILLFWLVLKIKFDWHKLAGAFIISGVIQAGLGIYQFVIQKVFANKWFGLAEHDPSILGDFVIETSSGRWLKAYGALPHPNILAGWLVICLLILIGVFMTAKMGQRKYIWQRTYSLVAMGIMFFALILTFSRSAWLVFVLGFLILFAIYLWQKNKDRLKVIGISGLLILLIVITTVFMLPEVWQTRLEGGRLEEMSSVERSEYYTEAGDLFKRHWYKGAGIGGYTGALYDIDTTHEAWDYQPVHNIYLLAAVELGIFGVAIFLVLLFWVAKSLYEAIFKEKDINNWHSIMLVLFISLIVIGLFDHYLWSLSFGSMFFWLVMGLCVKKINIYIS
ncbi:MAG: O-antigen ligase family protein [Candidatus Kerfeldbacteria bacterium]